MTNRNWIGIFFLILVFISTSVSASHAGSERDLKAILSQIEGNMVLIPAGEFVMGGIGEQDETPRHKVYLDAFRIGKYEVTFEEYETFCRATGQQIPVDPRYGFQPDSSMLGPTMPVMNVGRDDAVKFCRWLSTATGKSYRLPTEAEWEKAARGKLVDNLYPWGNESPDAGGTYRANYGPGVNHFVWQNDGYEYSAPVGSYPPNGYGLYDMAGNLWEWVSDWYDNSYYHKSPSKNPKGPPSGSQGIVRGGCYGNNPTHLRCAKRHYIGHRSTAFLVGFRIALNP